MATVTLSCRLEKESAEWLARRAEGRKLNISELASLFLKEKAREEQFPGIGFRDTWCGREAFITGHRVAVWEVMDVFKEAKTIANTADHFSWPEYKVEQALKYAEAFPEEVAKERAAEVAE